MTSNEPPEIQPDASDSQPIQPPHAQAQEPPAESQQSLAPGPSRPVQPSEAAKPVLPSDRIESPSESPPPESSAAPIIAGVITAAIVLATLAFFIFRDSPEPVAAPSSTAGTTATSLSPSTTQGSDVVPALGYEPRFESSRCEFTLLTDVNFECGWLIVPEDRQQPGNEREVRIHVALFESPNRNAPDDPIIYLDGGPGGSSLEPLTFSFSQVWEPLLADRDLILFDQRGVGYSEPSLDCPEEREWAFSVLDQDMTSEQERAGELDAIQQCRQRLLGEGIDLAQYNSVENAADVADLRIALGLDEVNLLGISYGTRLATTVMRDHPEGIRSVILDSTYTPDVDLTSEAPANFDRALSQLWAGCEKDTGCAARYPNLEQRFFDLVAAFEATPSRAPVRDFLNGGTWDVLFDGDWVLGTVFQGLYSDQVIPLLPQMVEELEERDTSTLSLLTSNTLANADFFSLGMMLSVQCHEEVSFSTQESIDTGLEGFEHIVDAFDGSSNLGDFMLGACDLWQAGTGSAAENEPVESDIPALVLAGEYDPITPPAWGASASAYLANSQFVEFPGLGHGTTISGDCPLNIAFEFLNDPTATVDTGCVDAMAPIDFKIPGEPIPPLVLVPFSEDIFGTTVTGLVPEGWTSVGFGGYARGDSAVDQTAILQQVAPLISPDAIIGLLAQQFNMVAEPEQTSTQESELGTWRLFRGDADEFSIDMAAIQLGGTTAIVVLISNPDERDQLVGELLLPAIEAFRADV